MWRDQTLTPSSSYRQAASAGQVSPSPGASSRRRGPIHLASSAAQRSLVARVRVPGWRRREERAVRLLLPPFSSSSSPSSSYACKSAEASAAASLPARGPPPPSPYPPPKPGWYAPVCLARLRWMLLEPTRRKEETQAGCGDPSGRPCLRDPFPERRHHDPGKGTGISPACTILPPLVPPTPCPPKQALWTTESILPWLLCQGPLWSLLKSEDQKAHFKEWVVASFCPLGSPLLPSTFHLELWHHRALPRYPGPLKGVSLGAWCV